MTELHGCREIATNAMLADDAIEVAATNLMLKVDKRHKKQCKKCPMHQQPGYIKLPTKCQCEQEKLQIEEGKKSPIMRSPIGDRRVMRRDGVAEKNQFESKLLKESVSHMVRLNLYLERVLV